MLLHMLTNGVLQDTLAYAIMADYTFSCRERINLGEGDRPKRITLQYFEALCTPKQDAAPKIVAPSPTKSKRRKVELQEPVPRDDDDICHVLSKVLVDLSNVRGLLCDAI